MIGSKLTLQALMRNDLTGQADDHGLARIKKESLFRLRRERTPNKQAAMYVWTWFRRQAFCTNLRLSVQICVPKIFKQQS
jgi:hypothetical protein